MEHCAIHDIEMKLVYDGKRVKRYRCPRCGSVHRVRVRQDTDQGNC